MGKISKDAGVTLVELPATQFGELDGETGYDIYSKFKLPPRALPRLAGVLRADGWTNVMMISPAYHGENGRLSKRNYNRIYSSPVLGISSIARTSPQSMKLADKYKQANPKGIVIAGGMDPSYRIPKWLEHADIVVIGEGEKTISELMERLSEDTGNLEGINGIAFKKNGEIILTEKRDLLKAEELGQLPLPNYDREIMRKIARGAIEQERGCPRNCNFCLVTQTYGRQIRHFPVEKTISEIRRFRQHGLGEHFFFTGDNAAGEPKHCLELMQAIKDEGLYQDGRTLQIDVAAAKNHALLQAMRSAGVRYVCVGFEAVTNDSLKDLGKPFTAEQNTEAARTFRDYGFWIHAMMMIGTDSDTPETAKETVEWTKKYADSAQFFVLGPLPGTRFYDKMEAEDRILKRNGEIDWYLGDGHHCLIKPANFSPYELQKTVFEAHKDFYSVKSSLQRLKSSKVPEMTLELLAYIFLFNGINKVVKSPQSQRHLKWLKEIS